MLNLDPSEGWITLKDGRRLPRTIFNKYNDKKIRYYNGGGGNKHKSPLRRLGEKVIAQRHSEEYKDKKKKEIEAAAQERAKILLEKSHQDDIIYDYLNAEYPDRETNPEQLFGYGAEKMTYECDFSKKIMAAHDKLEKAKGKKIRTVSTRKYKGVYKYKPKK